MELDGKRRFPRLLKSTFLQVVLYVLLIIFMANLSSIVDSIHHPEIPYFDNEHLIVGGITGIVSMVIFGLLFFHIRSLNKAMIKIDRLETLLPICSICKRIRIPDSDPEKMESWRQIESYITEKTMSEFSHGICPECFETHYAHLNTESRKEG